MKHYVRHGSSCESKRNISQSCCTPSFEAELLYNTFCSNVITNIFFLVSSLMVSY